MVFKLLEQAGLNIFDDEEERGRSRNRSPVNIKVIGVGGSGNNTITRLYDIGVNGAELIAMNTDSQQLQRTKAEKKILLGPNITYGKGAGGSPMVAYRAAEASAQDIADAVKEADLVFITAGMGGGTGTGAAPVVARVTKEVAKNSGRLQEPLVVGVVTFPFKMEGQIKLDKARAGVKELMKYADTVIVVDNNKLLDLVPNLPITQAFRVADEVIARMVKGLSETINQDSMVNIDYADVYTVMKKGGTALIGIGESNSKNRAVDAVLDALNNKMLDVEYDGGKAALVHFTMGPDVKLEEINKAMEEVNKRLGSRSEIIWGARIDDELEGYVRVMVIMTGIRSPYIYGSAEALQDEKREIPDQKLEMRYTREEYIDRDLEFNRDFYDDEMKPLYPTRRSFRLDNIPEL